MALPITTRQPIDDTEMIEVMRRIPRHEWVPWLDTLVMTGPVSLVPSAGTPSGRWTLRTADYDPFDDVLELVLKAGDDSRRILIDGPMEILAVEMHGRSRHVTIIADGGPLVIRTTDVIGLDPV